VTVLEHTGAEGAPEGAAQALSTLDFGALVDEHQAMVFSVAYHFLHDRPAAEEVAQEVFLSLHRHLADLQSAAHAGFWLRKVAVQRAIDEARRRKRRPQVSLEAIGEPSVRGAKSAPAGDPMLGATLRRLIASLPEAPRMVMILRYQEDLDPGEIAGILQMPVGTVKSHLQRSLALLREKLQRRGVGEFGWTG
jgi:RNA polymerase sigma-70 factor, ECF subfamily